VENPVCEANNAQQPPGSTVYLSGIQTNTIVAGWSEGIWELSPGGLLPVLGIDLPYICSSILLDLRTLATQYTI